MKFIVGTRSSKLAIAQTNIFLNLPKKDFYPESVRKFGNVDFGALRKCVILQILNIVEKSGFHCKFGVDTSKNGSSEVWFISYLHQTPTLPRLPLQ